MFQDTKLLCMDTSHLVQPLQSHESTIEQPAFEQPHQNSILHEPLEHATSLSSSSSLEHHKSAWTFEEEQLLFQLHNQFGNKWSLIAQHFATKQKSDNCVKNHFYSGLRKALRKLNKIIQTEYKKQIRQIKQNALYKIIEVTELKHKQNPQNEIIENRQDIQLCFSLKNRLLDFSYDRFQADQADSLKTGKKLIEQISAFVKEQRKTGRKSQSEDISEGKDKKKSKKSSLLRQTKNFGTILVEASSYDLFEESSSPSGRVKTRNGVKSRDEKNAKSKNQWRNFTLTMTESSQGFTDKSETFFAETCLLEDYFATYFPLLAKRVSSTEQEAKMNDELEEYEIFQQEPERRSRMRSQDHFEDPQLDEGKFSLFE